jgi:cytochrome c
MRPVHVSAAILSGCVAIAAIVVWTVTEPRPIFSKDAVPDQGGDPVKGQLVFAAGDCASCHASVGQTDRFRLGGGLALA